MAPGTRSGVDSGAASTRAPEALAGLRILVVDDNAALRGALRRLLAGEGAVVWEARDGRDALSQVRNVAGFDVVVLDIELPDMRGTELARVLRSHPDRCRIGVLVGVSGNGLLPGVERLLFDAFLRKPFSSARLRAVIDSCGIRCVGVDVRRPLVSAIPPTTE